MSERVAGIDVFSITVPRETIYLGEARPGEEVNERGYIVRRGNRTVYPTSDRTVVVRVTTESGVTGWGETYGIVTPQAAMAIIERSPRPLSGRTGPPRRLRDPRGFLRLHARARLYRRLLSRCPGGDRHRALGHLRPARERAARQAARRPAPRAASGLCLGPAQAHPRASAPPSRQTWQAKGFDSFKFASPVADDGVAAEMQSLREALGPKARIACDMHWAQTAEQAISLIRAMEPYGLWFAEAPVHTEDVEGLAHVARSVSTPVAAGEEWRTVHDLVPRMARRACGIVQPEMGHKGVTEFMRIGHYASAHHVEVIPHATIGIGLFMAASLHASAALQAVTCHEYQHSIFEPNRRLLRGDMDCRDGFYELPTGPGLGVEPSEEALSLLQAPQGMKKPARNRRRNR